MLFTVHFTVTVSEPLKADEFVFVTGNVPQLGEWHPHDAFKLCKTDDGHWTGTVSVGVDTIKFRYFIGYYLESETSKAPILIVSQWETHLTPRCVMPAVEATKTRVCRANVNDVFGFNGGREMVSDGWLVDADQNQILLTIQGTALKFIKSKYQREQYRLRVVPMDLRHHSESLGPDADEEMEESSEDFKPTLPSFSTAQIAVRNTNYEPGSPSRLLKALTQANPRFRDQNAQGEEFKNGEDYFIYRTLSVSVEYLGFRIEVYDAKKPDQPLAMGYALPSTLQDTFGKTSVPLITSKGLPVGKLYVGYLFVRPLKGDVPPQTMKASYAKHWKKRIALEVGHRGMGNSYTKLAAARENTLHSLNSAAQKGADYVEFDVHLTKDKIPIVFHDFHVLVSVAKRSPSIDDLSCPPASLLKAAGAGEAHELAVRDLKYSQLRLLHLDHVEHEKRPGEEDAGQLHYKVTGDHDEAEEHRPFPTLESAFHYVSQDTGFNIEIKYPMEWADGSHECANYFERNEFVDIILAQVLKNAGTRRVVFSSFDPDICTILTLKQNKYPVLFLCQGQTAKHPDYADARTQTSAMAVRFAAGTGLAGVNFHSEDLLRNAEPVAMAKHFGIITFVWGDELSDKSTVDYFKKTLGVDGVIYDRIGESESRSNVFLLERAMKEALFGKKKPPSPVQTPRHKNSTFMSQSEVNQAALAERLAVSTAALEHLDLPVTAASTVAHIAWPGLTSSASSTSSGVSTDSVMSTKLADPPTVRRQHCSFSQFYPTTNAREV
ncbi:hypothetical protein M3Y99_01653700 [Aphelenchoides fujianensis]|nr:hypothetical protein M3Y99_01653700 [Aphelenchoides fujianensis]